MTLIRKTDMESSDKPPGLSDYFASSVTVRSYLSYLGLPRSGTVFKTLSEIMKSLDCFPRRQLVSVFSSLKSISTLLHET